MMVDGCDDVTIPIMVLDASWDSFAHLSSDIPGMHSSEAPYSANLTVVLRAAASPFVSISCISLSICERSSR